MCHPYAAKFSIARRRELREIVENSQEHVETLQKQLRESEKRATEATVALTSTEKELERALPFEKEVKEKNLLIGKLRHEAVILNDHLTKALKYLKKGKPEDTIDKFISPSHCTVSISTDTMAKGNSSQTISCIFWLWRGGILRSSKSYRSSPACLPGVMVRFLVPYLSYR